MDETVRGMLAYRSLLDHTARIMRRWMRDEADAHVRATFEGMVRRSGRHVEMLDERLHGSAASPPDLVGRVLTLYERAAEAITDTTGRVLFLNALNRDVNDPTCELHACVGLIREGYEHAESDTKELLRTIFREQEQTLEELAALGSGEAWT